MIIVHLAQCCLIFQKKSSPLSKNFRKKTSQKIVAYKPLLIKHNECIKVLITCRFNDYILDDHFLVHEGCVIMMFYVPQEPKSGHPKFYH